MLLITISSTLMAWRHHGFGPACFGFCTGPESSQAHSSKRALQDLTGKYKFVSGSLLMPSCDEPDTLLQMALARSKRLGPESDPFQLF